MNLKIPQLSIRRVLTLAIMVYVALWALGVVFICRVFGIRFAIGISAILVFPLAVTARMRMRWPTLRVRHCAYLFTLVITVFVAAGGVVWTWYDSGMDDRHTGYLGYVEFRRVVRKDPAFRHVQVSKPEKNVCVIRGTLDSESDLVRLRSLEAQYSNLSWFEQLKVTHTTAVMPEVNQVE